MFLNGKGSNQLPRIADSKTIWMVFMWWLFSFDRKMWRVRVSLLLLPFACFQEISFYFWNVFSRAACFLAAGCRIYQVCFALSMCRWVAFTTVSIHMAPSWQHRYHINGSVAQARVGRLALVLDCLRNSHFSNICWINNVDALFHFLSKSFSRQW